MERFDDKYARKWTKHEALDALWPVWVVCFKYLNSSLTTERNNANQPRIPADEHLLSKICELHPNYRRQKDDLKQAPCWGPTQVFLELPGSITSTQHCQSVARETTQGFVCKSRAWASTQARKGHQQKGTESGPVINARQWTPIITSKTNWLEHETKNQQKHKNCSKGETHKKQTPPSPPPTHRKKSQLQRTSHMHLGHSGKTIRIFTYKPQ